MDSVSADMHFDCVKALTFHIIAVMRPDRRTVHAGVLSICTRPGFRRSLVIVLSNWRLT